MFDKREKNINKSARSSFSKKPLYTHAMEQETRKAKEIEDYNKLQQARHDNYKIDRNGVDGEQYNQSIKREEDTRIMAAKSIHKAATGSKVMLPVRVVELGVKLRRQMREGDNTAVQVAYILAFFMDFVFDWIPVLAFVTSFIFTPVLFIMLWGSGNWKIKAIRALLLFLEIIPVVGLLPLNIICVMHASHVLKKRAERAKIKYRELGMAIEST